MSAVTLAVRTLIKRVAISQTLTGAWQAAKGQSDSLNLSRMAF